MSLPVPLVPDPLGLQPSPCISTSARRGRPCRPLVDGAGRDEKNQKNGSGLLLRAGPALWLLPWPLVSCASLSLGFVACPCIHRSLCSRECARVQTRERALGSRQKAAPRAFLARREPITADVADPIHPRVARCARSSGQCAPPPPLLAQWFGQF